MQESKAFHFQSLYPDTILDALDSAGIRVDSGLTALNSYENRVYLFLDEQRRRWVVKFYRPERWNQKQILEEHQFAIELMTAEIPIVAPAVVQDKTLHEHNGFLFALFPSVGGREYEVDNEEQLEWVGRFLGRLHQTGKQSTFESRPIIGLDEYLYQSRKVLMESELIPADQKSVFMVALDKLIQKTESVWWNNWTPCRLHGDFHPGNILWRDGPMFVDLDDARTGPVVQDLWMLLYGDRAEKRIQLDILLEAYSEFSDFEMKELSLIEPLRSMRMIHYLAWLVRRWQDPAFPKSFPWLADSQFWHQQQQIFTEQQRLLDEEPIQLTPMY